MVDGFGSPDLSPEFIGGADRGRRAACACSIPGKRLFGQRINVLRRMHRKIVVVDGALAFVGGINYSADHLVDFGPKAKQDYAVEIARPDRRRDPSLRAACDRGQGQRYQRQRRGGGAARRLRASARQPAAGRRRRRACSSRATTATTPTTSSATTAPPSARRASAS